MRYLTIGLIVIFVSGCSHVPLSSALKLRRLDPLSADPQYFQIAVRMPDGFSVQRDGVVMLFGAKRTDIDIEDSQQFVFEKAASRSAARAANTTDGLEPRGGTHFEVFRIADADIARLRALQQIIRAWKADAPDSTRGSLSIQASGCRRSNLPEGPLTVSTFLRTDPAKPFLMLTRDVDLRSFTSGREPYNLPVCASPMPAKHLPHATLSPRR